MTLKIIHDLNPFQVLKIKECEANNKLIFENNTLKIIVFDNEVGNLVENLYYSKNIECL